MKGYITRVAPSPTGFAHIGTIRTALFNYLAARSSGGSFILRHDDTDSERNREECIKVTEDSLSWIGLKPDLIFRQSERCKRYAELAEGLVQNGSAIVCDNGAIALKWHAGMLRLWHDEIAGDLSVTDTNISHIDRKLILLRGSDKLGQATYQFASTVDDWDYSINYIIRGVDHTQNTPKQLAIWYALNTLSEHPVDYPKFAHVGLIFHEKHKLSKRDNAASLFVWRDAGYSQEAILNSMLRLGWGIDDKGQAYSLDEMVALFPNGRMKNSPANLDLAKMAFYQKVSQQRSAA